MIDIVIPFYKNDDDIENTFRAIADQDYKDYSVFLVFDGADENPGTKEVIEKGIEILGDKFNSDILIVNSGASAARNYGAELGKSEYILFLDADCRLNPGMLRECVTQLDDNPDVAFVYGNYRLITPDGNRQNFYSIPFNLHRLEMMNYICTMSPIRREWFDKVGGFNNELKYFQDWDFFYRVVKSGGCGKYLNSEEFIFETNTPTEESISGSQGLTLCEKAQAFYRLHGIEEKKLVVTTLGAPLQAEQRSEILNADYAGKYTGSHREAYPVNYAFNHWQGTYLVGCFNQTPDVLSQHFSVMYGKKIVHFIGSDVFHLQNNHSLTTLKQFSKAFTESGTKVFANSPRLVKELKEAFIDAELLYTPIFNIDQYKHLKEPEEFSVAVYYSDTNPAHMFDNDLSHMNLVRDVIESMPDVKFRLFGGEKMLADGNVQFCGRIPSDKMTDFINDCACVLRVTPHDGFPQLPIQFMLCGRDAIVTCPDESMKYAKHLSFEEWVYPGYEACKSEVISAIHDLKHKFEKNRWSDMAKKARKYYEGLMSEENFVKRVYEVLNED